jgi:hypothetical protein
MESGLLRWSNAEAAKRRTLSDEQTNELIIVTELFAGTDAILLRRGILERRIYCV